MAPSGKGEGAGGRRPIGRGERGKGMGGKLEEDRGGRWRRHEGETGGVAKNVVTLHPWGSLRDTGFWDHRRLGTTMNRNWQKSLGTISYTSNHKIESHLV